MYPALWSRGYPREDRSQDQHDAYAVAAWMREADRDGRLADSFAPLLTPAEMALARVEGWILGVG